MIRGSRPAVPSRVGRFAPLWGVLVVACGPAIADELDPEASCEAWEHDGELADALQDPWDLAHEVMPPSFEVTDLGQRDELEIVDWPIVYDEDRMRLTVGYLRYHAVDEAITGDLEADVTMVPRVVVLHWTAAPKAASTWWSFNPVRHSDSADPERALNLSTQFLVDRDGTIYRLFKEDLVGRHTIGLNHLSIGVENVGGGRRWPLTDAQVESNIALVRYLAAKYPITHVIGHHEYRGMEGHPYFREIDRTFRTFKCDPGARFLDDVRDGIADLGLEGVGQGQYGKGCRW